MPFAAMKAIRRLVLVSRPPFGPLPRRPYAVTYILAWLCFSVSFLFCVGVLVVIGGLLAAWLVIRLGLFILQLAALAASRLFGLGLWVFIGVWFGFTAGLA